MSKINETNYPRRTQASYEDTDMLVIQEAGGNTYTTRIEDLREDCQETLAPALNTMRENLATVEGSTASKAYAKGDFLVFGGRLCKAKTSIASGATLVLDTNIELDSVGDELSSISSDLASLGSAPVSLWADATYSPSTQHNLSQSKANFRFLLIMFRTNNERFFVVMPSGESTASLFCSLPNAAELNTDANMLKYMGYSVITFSSNTAFTYVSAYNNVNVILRPYIIYGIK